MRTGSIVFAHTNVFGVGVAALLFMMSGCAGERAPEGGPVDTTPPEITDVYPPPNTTEFSSSRISLEFSKYVRTAFG